MDGNNDVPAYQEAVGFFSSREKGKRVLIYLHVLIKYCRSGILRIRVFISFLMSGRMILS